MKRTTPSVARRHRARRRGRVEQVARVVDHRFEQRRGRPFDGGDGREQRQQLGRKPGHTLADELFQGRRHRQRRTCRSGDLRELEREHRIAAGRLLHAREQWPRNAQAESRPDQMVERADAQRADANLVQALVEGVAELERVAAVAALRREDPDGSVAQASGREGKDPLRRGIEPLDVVDREQHLRASGERAQAGEERSRQGDAIRGLARGRLETDRDGKRPTLRLGELLRHLGKGIIEQVGETAERERDLRFRAPRHEDPARRPAEPAPPPRARARSCRSLPRRESAHRLNHPVGRR